MGSIALPVFLVTMASQNIPGFAVLRANGYEPPSPPLLVGTGISTLIAAPFGGHARDLDLDRGAVRRACDHSRRDHGRDLCRARCASRSEAPLYRLGHLRGGLCG